MPSVSKLDIFKLILVCLISLLVVSCKSYFSALTIETPGPAKQELSQDIQSLTLMNRSMNKQFVDHHPDTLQNYFYNNGYQLSVVVLDSLASDTTLRALGELLFESGRYDVVIPVERNIGRAINYNMIPDTLSPVFVKEQLEKYNTDALMVLEKFSMKVMTDFVTERFYDRYTGSQYEFFASLDVKYDALFRIYKPGNKIQDIMLSDTIYWEEAEGSQVRLFNRLPSIKQALVNGGIKIALDMDSKISPVWTQEKRGYFLFDRKDDRGRQLINENDIKGAKAFWMEKAQSTNKKIKSRAEYNLALASELEGNIDEAIEWGLKSYNTLYHYQTEVYLKKLDALRDSTLTK